MQRFVGNRALSFALAASGGHEPEAQLLWLNLVTNGVQDIALAFEPGGQGVTQRPPRPPREGIISRLLWERAARCG